MHSSSLMFCSSSGMEGWAPSNTLAFSILIFLQNFNGGHAGLWLCHWVLCLRYVSLSDTSWYSNWRWLSILFNSQINIPDSPWFFTAEQLTNLLFYWHANELLCLVRTLLSTFSDFLVEAVRHQTYIFYSFTRSKSIQKLGSQDPCSKAALIYTQQASINRKNIYTTRWQLQICNNEKHSGRGCFLRGSQEYSGSRILELEWWFV
jgi:hypothetical protein